MSAETAATGLPVRVYYENTDAGGVVYHADYLAFMERARTEWLRTMGFDNSGLARDHGVVFAVRRAEVDFLKPACLDDALVVTAEISKRGRASLDFEQQVLRDEEILCRGIVKLVCVACEGFRPTAIPAVLLDRVNNGR